MKSSSGTATDLRTSLRDRFKSNDTKVKFKSKKDKDRFESKKKNEMRVSCADRGELKGNTSGFEFRSNANRAVLSDEGMRTQSGEAKSSMAKARKRGSSRQKCGASLAGAPSKMVDRLEYMFYRLGFFIALHPYAVIAASLLVVALSSFG